MKRLITVIIFSSGIFTDAQVAIGKNEVANSSVSLEFGDTENRGIIVPYIENKNGIIEEGTLIYDTSDNKVKYLKGNGVWVNLSEDDGTSSTIGKADLSIQGPDKTELETSKVSIGVPNTADGILVLSDNNKAMILPKVASPHLQIVQPAAGMMVYDTTARQLAVYTGTTWSFWKP